MITPSEKAPEVKDLQGVMMNALGKAYCEYSENNREKQAKEVIEFARIGDHYYQRVYNPNAQANTYIPRDRQELKADGVILPQVRKFSMFTNLPSHTDYQREIHGAFNLYEELNYTPQAGNIDTSMEFLRHVFGEQLELALDYLTILWRHPTQILPILVLISKEQGTGKSSFMRWLRRLFGANVTILNVSQYCQQFNGVYASKLLICIDEAALSEEFIKERLKQDSTATEINLRKMRTEFNLLPFFGKFVVASNKEIDFCKLEDEDVRFWVVKLGKFDVYDPCFADKLADEIPAFASFLDGREIVSPNASRMWFTASQLETDALNQVRANSISDCAKDIQEFIADKLAASVSGTHIATATELYEALGRKYALKIVSKAVREELGYGNKCTRYKDANGNERNGRAFCFGFSPEDIDSERDPFCSTM